MASFIANVLKDLSSTSNSISDTVFILPSKRAGLFLKKELSKLTNATVFAPTIYSIEEFVENLSQLKSVSHTEILFHFYSCFIALSKNNPSDNFETFSQWATVLIQDFNEIDRYLVPPEKIFDHVAAIKKIDAWLVESEKTQLISNHLAFWSEILNYYKALTDLLLQKGIAYQGLIYREAVEHLESYVQAHQHEEHVFIGFNALNRSESIIIQVLLNSGNAKIYWDFDAHYSHDPLHVAGHFFRMYDKHWKLLNKTGINWVQNLYERHKQVSVYGVPKNVGQAKTVSQILSQLEPKQLENTALVLADEQLLIPILNSIPNHLGTVNVTMGFPMVHLPITSLFELLFNMHKKNRSSFYFKDVGLC